MTANRMHHWGDAHSAIGFEQHDAPVTNTLKVQADLTDGNVEVSFCSTWAQAGASHSTDGALVLLRADAEALAAVLAPREAYQAPVGYAIAPIVATKAMLQAGMRYFNDKSEPATKAWQCYREMLSAAELHKEDMRAALIAAGWLPPERLEAIAASWDGFRPISGFGAHDNIGDTLREEFKS